MNFLKKYLQVSPYCKDPEKYVEQYVLRLIFLILKPNPKPSCSTESPSSEKSEEKPSLREHISLK